MNAAKKDKRVLVLFLLGCGMLLFPYLSRDQRPLYPVVYGIKRVHQGDQWQVFSLAETAIDTAIPDAQCYIFPQGHILTSQFHVANECREIPPALAMFLNRPMSLNKSHLHDLEMLPGIGPTRAATIIAARERKGKFTGPEDLLDLPGIGPATLQRILPMVSFE